jgi:DNA adenine methylase
MTVYEPFCGGLGMTEAIASELPLIRLIASDVAPGLIELYQAIQRGWEPPEQLSRAEWTALREHRGTPRAKEPLVAFAGFGCSFNGVYFAAYGEPKFAGQARRALKRKLEACEAVTFISRPYQSLQVDEPCVIYADKVYEATDSGAYRALRQTPYESFDHEEFWDWARAQASRGAHVLVSEYTAPDWARLVMEKKIHQSTRAHAGQGGGASERLFYVGPET